MVFREGKLQTKKVNSAVELICRSTKGFGGNENKKNLKIQSFPGWCPIERHAKTVFNFS
jgi:hypothetical protein